LIEHSGRSEAHYHRELENLIVCEKLSARAEESAESWANESFKIAKRVWVNEGGLVDEAYYRANIRIVDEQLALAGLRLATVMNQALGTEHSFCIWGGV